jgi:hypothetical protein
LGTIYFFICLLILTEDTTAYTIADAFTDISARRISSIWVTTDDPTIKNTALNNKKTIAEYALKPYLFLHVPRPASFPVR